MRRRELLILLGCAAIVSPIATIAQQTERVRHIGVLIGLAERDPEAPHRVAAFRQGLQELGWAEGRNIRISYRFATDAKGLQSSAKELVTLKPDLIVAGSSPVAAALLRETRTTPVVFVTASDPIGDGLVASLARPAGNATGFTHSLASMGGKWLELLKEVAPGTTRVAVMFNRETAPTSGAYFLEPIEAVAASFGVRPLATPVREPAEIESVLIELAREPGGSLIVMPDNFTAIHRGPIIAQATRYRVPAVYPLRSFAISGGLMSYGADMNDLYRRTPIYVDRILRGARPAELPVQAPAKFELVVNLKAAKELGLTVPRIVLARADEVIE